MAMSAVQLSESSDCARCGEALGGDMRRLRTCPHCGAKKAGRCRLCGAAVYLGTDICFAHRPKEARPTVAALDASPVPAPAPSLSSLPPGSVAYAPARKSSWTPARVLGAVAAGIVAFFVTSVIIGAVVLAVVGTVGADAPDKSALSSPARPLIKEPCASYREISFRLAKNEGDQIAALDAVNWVTANRQVFADAARLDPSVAAGAESVAWLGDLVNDPARLARTPMDEIKSHEAPLVDVCTKGAGQA